MDERETVASNVLRRGKRGRDDGWSMCVCERDTDEYKGSKTAHLLNYVHINAALRKSSQAAAKVTRDY